MRGGISGEVKLNDRPTDTFSGEAGDDMSVPRRRTNGTAPGRVACQSLKGETANKKRSRQGKEGILFMQKQSFMRADEVAQELDISKSHAYKVIHGLNEELQEKGYLTISGRVNREFFREKYYYTKTVKEES